ncbi:MAG: Ig-like domain-containing protein [Akkermansiaceae bacterium]|nr:Ig-like domain-containing protein [Akkermansiaceae bacterium]
MKPEASRAITATATVLLFFASARQGHTADFYIGDAAAEGRVVTTGGGTRADTVPLLTYVLHGGTAIYPPPNDQRLRLTEVNFFAESAGTLTPFVARYDRGGTQQGTSYEILSIGDPLAVKGGNVLVNRAFTVGGVNPVISVNAGDQIAVGWLQDGNIVYLKEPGPGTPDYISNGNALNGTSVGGNLTMDSNWAFDRDMRFNIGVDYARLRILPLGDSITDGSAFDSPDGTGGYRGPLYDLLVAAGYEVDYVGTSTVNSEQLVEKEHEGHSGWTISQIDANVAGWLNAIADPDFILLHIGTNDFRDGVSDPAAITRLDNLITKIVGLRPKAHIIVTNLMERGEPQNTHIQNDFNRFVHGVVNAHVMAGHLVSFLDMRAAVPLSDMPDHLHPDQDGYDKMAAAWFGAIDAVIIPPDLTPPLIVEVLGSRSADEIIITFDEPLDQASAEDVGNYAVSDGVTVLSAVLSANLRTVTLTTSPQALGVAYTLTVNGVQDLAPTPNTIATDTPAQFSALPPLGLFPNAAIPDSEKSGMQSLYELDIPAANPSYRDGTPVPYTVDKSASVPLGYARIGYYVEVTGGTQAGDWVYISMDVFDPDPSRLGLPHNVNNPVARQDIVTNANIYSNNASIVTGTGLAMVNLEMWSTNYGESDSVAIPNGTGRFDWSDTGFGIGTGHGSFQIHNHDAANPQTLFGWSDWGGNSPGVSSEFGIGNATLLGNPNEDWTFSDDGQEGFLQIVVGTPSLQPLRLTIAGNGANLDFTWESQAGKVYDLLSATDLSTALATWAVWNGNQDIAATPDTNLLSISRPADALRFFAVAEKDAPPLFFADFKDGSGGFTNVNHGTGSSWEFGDPDSTGPGGTVSTGNGGSPNCWGTNIARPGYYLANTDASLRSPVIDLTGVSGATLSFARAIDMDSGHTLVVNIIDDTTDTVIESAIHTSTDAYPTTANWETINSIAIAGAALGQPVRIEWRFTNNGGTDYMGAYIDDVSVTVP